jgi:hypothetical protein
MTNPTYADVRAAMIAAWYAGGADGALAAILDLFMRAGVRDGTAILDALVEPGTDPIDASS